MLSEKQRRDGYAGGAPAPHDLERTCRIPVGLDGGRCKCWNARAARAGRSPRCRRLLGEDRYESESSLECGDYGATIERMSAAS
jgi:hypothetical protein